MSIAVLPPTAASTMPSSVVGIRTTGTPRSQVAAANPARSVAAPPPMPTTQSDLVTLASASQDHSRARTATSLAASPAGTPVTATRYPASSSVRQAALGQRREPLVVDDGHRLRPLADQAGQRAQHPRADDHLIRLVPADWYPGHGPSVGRSPAHVRSRLARSAATSSGARSSVGTVSVASSA